MSNLAKHNQVIGLAQDSFISINESNGKLLDWKTEANFAHQLLTSNDFLMKVAMNNQASLKQAMINVASIGLTLNKALQYAYLVPRKGVVCLDIGYRGLVKLATDSGSVKWAKSEIVRENDYFEYNGLNNEPIHKISTPFDEKKRGDIVGVYCLARLKDGDYMTELMSINQILEIRACSENATGQYSPWTNHFEEMAKKTVIKRASKHWPKTDINTFHEAVQIINEHEGLQKAISYEGEPINSDDFHVSDKMKEQFYSAFEDENPLDMYFFQDTTTPQQWDTLFKSFPTEKTKCKNKVTELYSEGRKIMKAIYEEWITCIHNNDETGSKQLEDFGSYQETGMKLLHTMRKAHGE